METQSPYRQAEDHSEGQTMKSYSAAIKSPDPRNYRNNVTAIKDRASNEDPKIDTNFLEIQANILALQRQMQDVLGILSKQTQPVTQQGLCQCRFRQH